VFLTFENFIFELPAQAVCIYKLPVLKNKFCKKGIPAFTSVILSRLISVELSLIRFQL
jgi:hypothetical protein